MNSTLGLAALWEKWARLSYLDGESFSYNLCGSLVGWRTDVDVWDVAAMRVLELDQSVSYLRG